jgi:outer membrane protein TolC
MSQVRTAPGTSASPSTPWKPPAGLTAAEPPPAGSSAVQPSRESQPGKEGAGAIPPDLLETASHWTLSDLVDLALRTSPKTRVAWAEARAAAADLGAKDGVYYPTIAGVFGFTAARGSVAGGRFTFQNQSTNPFIALNWLLLDFGGRKATVDSARQALIAADWIHNAVIQEVVLEVQQAFYTYLYARALEEAENAAVKEAETSLDAAEARRAAGLATVADVLQAKTRLSEARLALETVEGGIQTIHGSLATAIGLPANTHFDVALPSYELPEERAAVEVERAIAEAQAQRPDLAAARALVERAQADLRARKAADRPSLNTVATAGRIWYAPFDLHQDTYTASLLLTVPIFNGLTYQYNVFRAEADRDAAVARVDTLEQEVTFQVWSSYYNHKTAEQKVATAKDLLASARESYDVASARYKAGVGSILDLLVAQSALERARAQEAQARADWFLTLAQLTHDTGTLWRPEPAGAQRSETEGMR